MNPFIHLETVRRHVVQLLRNFMNACEYQHVIVKNACAMTTPRGDGSNIALYLRPRIGLEIEGPEVLELLVVLVFATENVHLVIIHNCRMTSSWLWTWTWLSLNSVPSERIKVESNESVLSHTSLESTKNDHMLVVNYCRVLIARFWDILAFLRLVKIFRLKY